jgi:hypothetical protein
MLSHRGARGVAWDELSGDFGTLNFVSIMAAHREVAERKWGVIQINPRLHS